jgi:hypothetical protein
MDNGPEKRSWLTIGLGGVAFVLLRDLLGKTCLTGAEEVSLCALAIALPILAVSTVDLATTPKEHYESERLYLGLTTLAGALALAVGIVCLLWSVHRLAAILFGVVSLVLSGMSGHRMAKLKGYYLR